MRCVLPAVNEGGDRAPLARGACALTFGTFRQSKPLKKKKKPPRPFAHSSVYAHLGGLTDSVRPGLDVMLCGINPGECSLLPALLTRADWARAGVESGKMNCHCTSAVLLCT